MGATINNDNNRTTSLERTAAKDTGGLHAFYWRQIFALASTFVKTQVLLASMDAF